MGSQTLTRASSSPPHSDRGGELRARLRRARLAAGLTQTQVAARLGRPQSFVSKCESGERHIKVAELETFAHLYGTTPERLYGDDG